MMNMTDIATWSQILSSAAVLVTLVYLAVETKQNTTAIQANARHASLAADLQFLYLEIEHPGIALARLKSELNDAEKIQVSNYLAAFFRTQEFNWLQYQAGILNESAWSVYRSVISVVLSNRRARDWWKRASPNRLAPSFIENINKLLETLPATDELTTLAWID